MNTFICFTNAQQKKWALNYFMRKGCAVNNNNIAMKGCYYCLNTRYCNYCTLEDGINWLNTNPGKMIYASKSMNTQLDFLLNLIK